LDGHYAEAVEEAYKHINNAVKRRCRAGTADGAALMQTAFSPARPLLRLNSLRTRSEQDEQLGYMHILAGCMTGVRNPRAHEHDYREDPRDALAHLVWADHLLRRVNAAKRCRGRSK
jgi:uncharacterized protein (TIGR02391 family)